MAYSILDTDGYKFSMAEAGFPLRQETFYYSHRRGGWQYLPVDVEKFIQDLLPTEPTTPLYNFLETNGYHQGGAFRQAIRLQDQIKIKALPKGSWFYEREPVFTVTGPSALVSWLEPLVLQLHLRIQVATAALLNRDSLAEKVAFLSSHYEKRIISETLESVRVHVPSMVVRREDYYEDVLARAKRLVKLVGDPNRLFEVGMRAVSCQDQHRLALGAVLEAGITRTSNVGLAAELSGSGMVPVGTMGHEHVQRHGSDYAAYTSMRDKFPGFIFYLPDTFDTLASGIPSALAVMLEDPKRNSGIRFDSESGIVGHYLYAVNRAREVGLTPLLGLESGWNEELTLKFEQLREMVGWPRERQAYGYGGYLVKPPWSHFGRDDVSAVWKITQSGSRATMKFGDEPGGGKASIPGRPILYRPTLGSANYGGPIGIVAQEGEKIYGSDYVQLSGCGELPLSTLFHPGEISLFKPGNGRFLPLEFSPATRALMDRCQVEKLENINRASTLLRR